AIRIDRAAYPPPIGMVWSRWLANESLLSIAEPEPIARIENCLLRPLERKTDLAVVPVLRSWVCTIPTPEHLRPVCRAVGQHEVHEVDRASADHAIKARQDLALVRPIRGEHRSRGSPQIDLH